MSKKLLMVILGLVLASCATKTALTKSANTLDTSQQSIGLFSLEIGRNTASRYIPRPRIIRVKYKDAEGKSQFKALQVDKDAGNGESETKNKFLVSITLPPGNYQLESIYGQAAAFPFIGHFNLPLLLDFTLQANSVSYMGKINALIRPRVGEEFRAGPVIPLIDQGVAGISGSTFDIEVAAGSGEIDEFRKNFPVLESMTIDEKTLPAFDRAKVQEWWQNGEKSQSK